MSGLSALMIESSGRVSGGQVRRPEITHLSDQITESSKPPKAHRFGVISAGNLVISPAGGCSGREIDVSFRRPKRDACDYEPIN